MKYCWYVAFWIDDGGSSHDLALGNLLDLLFRKIYITNTSSKTLSYSQGSIKRLHIDLQYILIRNVGSLILWFPLWLTAFLSRLAA